MFLYICIVWFLSVRVHLHGRIGAEGHMWQRSSQPFAHRREELPACEVKAGEWYNLWTIMSLVRIPNPGHILYCSYLTTGTNSPELIGQSLPAIAGHTVSSYCQGHSRFWDAILATQIKVFDNHVKHHTTHIMFVQIVYVYITNMWSLHFLARGFTFWKSFNPHLVKWP